MDTNDMINELARSARYPAIPRVRLVHGATVGPWILLGAFKDRAAANDAVSAYMRAHAVQGRFQGSILELSHPDYPEALAQVRQRKTRTRTRTRTRARTRSRT